MELYTVVPTKPHVSIGVVDSQKAIALHTQKGFFKKTDEQEIVHQYETAIYRAKEQIVQDVYRKARDAQADAIVGFTFQFLRVDETFLLFVGYGTMIKYSLSLEEYRSTYEREQVSITQEPLLETHSLTKPDTTATHIAEGEHLVKLLGGDKHLNFLREIVRQKTEDRLE